jgi:carbon monoxide dehydrogenase subunit G
MELTGQVQINAPRDKVWQALNDAATLMACIPGCESVEMTSQTERHVRVLVKAGPVRARFVGRITLSEVVAGSGCVMTFEGSGGNAGMATGRSSVALSDQDGGTLVRYTASAAVGGKLGQIGARMLDSAAKQMADQFFTRLGQSLGGQGQAAAPVTAVIGQAASAPSVTPASAAVAGQANTSEWVRVMWFLLGAGVMGFGVLIGAHLG